MRAQGNCLPFRLDDVRIAATLAISAEQVTNLAFLSNNEIIVLTSSGKIFLCNIVDTSCAIIQELPESKGAWGLHTHNEDIFLAMYGGTYQTESELDKILSGRDDIIFLNRSGREIGRVWDIGVGCSQLVYDGDRYVMLAHHNNLGVDLYSISESGLVLEMDLGFSMLAVHDLFTTRLGLIDSWHEGGPFIISKAEDGTMYMELWNENWNQGRRYWILDSEDRLIGPRTSEGELVILERGTVTPITIPYDDLPGFEEWRNDPSYPLPNKIASNGSDIVLLWSDTIARYSGRVMQIWIDNLSDYCSEHGDEYTPGQIYIDADADSLLFAVSGSILVVDEDIKRIEFSGIRSTQLIFSPDLTMAAIGTGEGNVIIMNLILEQDQAE